MPQDVTVSVMTKTPWSGLDLRSGVNVVSTGKRAKTGRWLVLTGLGSAYSDSYLKDNWILVR